MREYKAGSRVAVWPAYQVERMKTKSIQILIALLGVAAACAQTSATLQYVGYDPAPKYFSSSFIACQQVGTGTPSSDATGFTVPINLSCQDQKSGTIQGSLRVDFSSQIVPITISGTWKQDFAFPTPLTVTANAQFNVSAPATDASPAIQIEVTLPEAGNTFYDSVATMDCTASKVSAASAQRSCAVTGADGMSDTSGPPLYIGAYLSIPINLGSGSWSVEMKLYGKFSLCTGSACTVSGPAFDHIEVVQVVPVTDPKTSAPIVVPNKSTVVRVFGTSSQPADVSVTLKAVDRGGTLPSHYASLGPNKPDPDSPVQSADFLLPPEWTTSGPLTLQAQYQVANSPTVVSDLVPLVFKPADGWPAKFRVAAIQVCERLADQSNNCAGSDTAPLGDLGGFMRKILPLSDLFRAEYFVAGVWHLRASQMTMPALREKLAWMYLQLAAKLGANAPDLLLAWYPRDGVIAQSPGANTATFSWLTRMFGINHVVAIIPDAADRYSEQIYLGTMVAGLLGPPIPFSPKAIGVAGYDPQAAWVWPSTSLELHDKVFVAGDAFQTWISPSQYLALYNAYAPKTTPSPSLAPLARAAVPAAASPSSYLLITGTVQADSSAASFDPGFLTTSANAPAASDPSGSFCLHFGAGSAALGDYCFQASFQDPGTGAALPSAAFAIQAPFPSGTTRVSLVVNSGASKGKELAAVNKSATAPTVQITSPHTGDHLNAGQLNLTWTATAAGGAALTYNLSTSADGGATWTPLDVALTDTQYQLDTTQIAGGSQVMFLVEASDGLNTGTATVGPLTLTQTPQISLPASPFNYGKALVGAGADQLIPISNTGTGPLTVTAATLNNSAFSFISPVLPITVNAGAQQGIDVRFAPTTTGVQPAVLQISSSDPAHATVSMTLSAEGITTFVPSVSLATQSLDCGSAAVGQSADVTLNLSNVGPAPLTVSAAQSSNAMFSLTAPALPFTVANHSQQAITVHFAPTAAGAQSATLTLSTNDPAAPAVTVHLIGTATAAAGNAPQIKAGGIVNAASYSTTLARGSLATIFGTNLSTSTAQALPLPWAKSLGGASVTVGGVAAPLYYASPTQINFQVPYEVPAGSSANVVATSGGVPGTATPVALADYAMGVFTYARTTTAVDPIVVHYSNNQLVTPTSPAAPGEILVLYGTGVGKLNNPPPTGVAVPISPLATPVDPFTMTLGGAPVPVLFTGLTPGCAGLVQMDIQLPATLPAGSSLPVVIQFPGGASPVVNLAVQGSTTSAPKLTLSTSALAFGSVTVGQSKDLSVTVSNTGTAALNVNSPAVSGAGFSLVPAVSAFTLQPGGALPVTVRYTPASAAAASGTLTIASNDSSSPATVALSGTGVSATGPTPGTVSVSDSFNRADSTGCALGKADLALGGSGSHYYLPINSTTGVSLVSGALQNNTLDYAGVQLTVSASCNGGGETLLQDLYMRVDLLVPASTAGVVQAGPYFRSRAAAPGDGIIGGSSAGYWVTLTSAGEVRLRGLNPNAVIATTGVSASFNAAIFHKLEIVAQGLSLQVWLDGARLTFTQNGAAVSSVALPSTAGSNNGAAGIAFADEDNRGKAGGQRARNLVIAQVAGAGS